MQEGFLIVGRGLGQVMVPEQCGFGFVDVSGNSLQLVAIGSFGLLGNFVGTVTAFFSGYSKEDIEDGLYGFNGTLVGIAVGVFMEPGVASLLLLVAGSMLSTWIAACSLIRNFCPVSRLLSSLPYGCCRPFAWVVPLIVVIFCDAGRNGSRLVPGFSLNIGSGDVPRRHGAFRTFLFGRHIAQFPRPCLVYGVGCLVAFGRGLDGRFRLCSFQCRSVGI